MGGLLPFIHPFLLHAWAVTCSSSSSSSCNPRNLLWPPHSSSCRGRSEAAASKRGRAGKGGRHHGQAPKPSSSKRNIWQEEEGPPPSAGGRSRARRRPVQGGGRRGGRGRRSKGRGGPSPPPRPATALVSAAMPVETESVLQTRLPVSTPSWSSFTKSLVGVWRGVGATFSPITAEMEPIAYGDNNEYLYDCRIISTIEDLQSGSSIQRRTLWAVGNPLSEQGQMEIKMQSECMEGKTKEEDRMGEATVEEKTSSVDSQAIEISRGLDDVHLSFQEIMEEDTMELEPGLVFFQDGSYSRGPLELLLQENNSEYFSSPTYRIEQCLVIGHNRLRMVHTISVENAGQEIQILRVAAYEEEWMGLESVSGKGDGCLKLFSQRRRFLPHELSGSWKVFEISVTPVMPERPPQGSLPGRPTFVYLSLESVKRRLPPDIPVHFVDEDILDMQNVTVLWLPGGITAYVDIKEDGIMLIGAGWCSDDGVNYIIEREYNADGKLTEVRLKSEVKT